MSEPAPGPGAAPSTSGASAGASNSAPRRPGPAASIHRPFAAAPLLFSACALLAACGAPERVSFAPGGEADLYAVITLDGGGQLSGATGIRPFSGSASVYTSGGAAVALGWRSEALAGFAQDPGALERERLRPAAGCVQRLPVPAVAVRLEDGAALDPAALPPLTAAWLEDACPEVDPERFAFDLECKRFRCPLTVTRRSRCRFEFDLDCNFGQLAGTLRADGSLCLEATPPLACQPEDTGPPRAAASTCAAPEPCRLEAYLTAPLPLEVDTLRFLEAPPFSPTPSLIGQLVLPPAPSRFMGYAHDFAVGHGKVAISVGPGSAVTGCGFEVNRGTLDVYDADTLVRTASAAVQGCLARLAPDEGGFLGLRAMPGRFELTRFSTEGRITESVRADPRPAASAGEPPLFFEEGARPTYFEIVGGRLIAAVVRSQPAGTAVFTWDLETLEPLGRAWLEGATVVAGARADERTVVLGDAFQSRVHWLDVESLAVRRLQALPPDVDRDDNFVFDVAWTELEPRALLTISRKNAAVYGVNEAMGVVSRSVVFDGDHRPMATLPWPGREVALVAGAHSTDQVSWPARLSLFDLRRSRFLPGSVSVGHGPPGRTTADPRGRLWVLLPWDAKLLRVTMR